MRPGQRLGQYELICQTAQGGMASIWLARSVGSRGFKKVVAIKTMLPTSVDDPDAERMFLAEAAVASRIDHPNVVQTLDLCEDSGVLYLVMEWVGGETLGTVYSSAAARGGLPLGTAVRIVSQIAAGLHAAHELTDASGKCLGLVHRDVSPHNVLVGFNGVVKVVDFGIATLASESEDRDERGELKGKVPYMAPEQIRLESVDRRVDIFATGILLYLLTTGRHPFKRADAHETAMAILSDAPAEPPSSVLASYPPKLERVVQKALAKNPSHRYATARELGDDLLRALPPSFKGSGHEELRGYMQDLLPGHFAKHQQLVRVARDASESSFASAPLAIGQVFKETRRSSSTLRAVAVSARASGAPNSAAPPPEPTAAPETGSHRSSKAVLLLDGAGLSVALGLVSLTHPSGRSNGSEQASASSVNSSSAPSPEPADVDPAIAPQPSAAPPPGTAAPAAAAAAQSEEQSPPSPESTRRAPSLPATVSKSINARPKPRLPRRAESRPGAGDTQDLKDPY